MSIYVLFKVEFVDYEGYNFPELIACHEHIDSLKEIARKHAAKVARRYEAPDYYGPEWENNLDFFSFDMNITPSFTVSYRIEPVKHAGDEIA